MQGCVWRPFLEEQNSSVTMGGQAESTRPGSLLKVRGSAGTVFVELKMSMGRGGRSPFTGFLFPSIGDTAARGFQPPSIENLSWSCSHFSHSPVQHFISLLRAWIEGGSSSCKGHGRVHTFGRYYMNSIAAGSANTSHPQQQLFPIVWGANPTSYASGRKVAWRSCQWQSCSMKNCPFSIKLLFPFL